MIKRNGGISGVGGGIKSIAQLTALQRPSGFPASSGVPPASTGSKGNRTTAVPTSVYKAQDSAQIQMVNGIAHWSFKTAFTKPPTVQVTPVGGTSGVLPGTFVFIEPGFPTNIAVIINSTDPSDGRIIHMTAQESN